MHIHSFGQPCEGWLYIADGKTGFRPITKEDHAYAHRGEPQVRALRARLILLSGRASCQTECGA
jgi:hypothetical protein